MRHWIKRTIWQGYFICFSWGAFFGVLKVLHPRAIPGVFYWTMIAFDEINAFFHIMAVLSATLTLISIWTLFAYAFNITPRAKAFFKYLFLLRIALLFLFPHTFEGLVIRSTMHDRPVFACAIIAFYASYMFPSFLAHYVYFAKANAS